MPSLDKNIPTQKPLCVPQRKVIIFSSILFTLLFFGTQKSNAYECRFPQQVDGGGDVAYQNRGHYCEGLSPQNYNFDSTISILGYFARPIKFPTGTAGEIEVRRHTPPSDEVEVYINSFSPRKNYRLDASIPKNVNGFSWKLDVIRDTRVNLGKQNLTALGCVPSCEARHRVLVPLTLSPISNQKEELDPYMVVKFPLETESVQIRYSDLEGVEIAVGENLKRPKFRPELPRRIRLPEDINAYDKFVVDILAFQKNGVPIPMREVLLGANDNE